MAFVATNLAFGVLIPAAAVAQQKYSIEQIGLVGPEYVNSSGQNVNSAVQQTPSGKILGVAPRQGPGALGNAYWLFDGESTFRIGLFDAAHTSNAGFQDLAVLHPMNQAGQVLGRSQRFGPSGSLGTSIWLFDGQTTKNIGLTGPNHTRNDGYKASSARQLNEAGYAIGSSSRFLGGSTSLGQSAWLHVGTTTVDIGLLSPEHTRNDGYRTSSATWLNESGWVIGTSERFNGGSVSRGQSAWWYTGSGTVNIGLTDAVHTGANNTRSSTPRFLNNSGQIVGDSVRYGSGGGQTAWWFNASNLNGTLPIDIGLTGTEHTTSNGYRFSQARQLNEAGQVIGIANRFLGGTGAQRGTSAWFYDGATTRIIGLTDSEHTHSDGTRTNNPVDLNQAGFVVGSSNRYSGTQQTGSSAWLFDGAQTHKIGLTGPEYILSNGSSYSSVNLLNEAGQAAGTTLTPYGSSTWLYENGVTHEIGLTGPEYEDQWGIRDNSPYRLTESGLIAGNLRRYNELFEETNTAWIYDPLIGTVPIELSTDAFGLAQSWITYFGEDGIALGQYWDYDTYQSRAFYWSRSTGVRDLGQLVDGGLDANGWSALGSALSIDAEGRIVGGGSIVSPNANQWVYVLTPVPEPSSVALAGIGSMVLAILAAGRARGAMPR